jgi:hypothetical protein
MQYILFESGINNVRFSKLDLPMFSVIAYIACAKHELYWCSKAVRLILENARCM